MQRLLTASIVFSLFAAALDVDARPRRRIVRSTGGDCTGGLRPKDARVDVCPEASSRRPVCVSEVPEWRAYEVARSDLPGEELPPHGVPPMKIWADTRCRASERVALDLLESVEGDHIREEMIRYMGRAPRPDGGVGCVEGRGNGGDPGFDVYITDDSGPIASGGGVHKFPNETSCEHVPVYMTLDVATPAALAHEYCHAIQYAYTWAMPGCLDSLPEDPGMGPETMLWWAEATATAGESLLYPGRRQRDKEVDEYMRSTASPVDARRPSYGYSVYLLPLFLELGVERGTIAGVWDALQTAPSVAEAIARVTEKRSDSDDLLSVWPLFTRELVNRAPWNAFCRWEDLPHRPKIAEEQTLALERRPDAEVTFGPPELQRLSAVFYQLNVGSDVRSLTFLNPFTDEKAVSVQAHITFADGRIDGQDWTKDEQKFFCLDRKDERITAITLVVSNSTWRPGAAPVKAEKPIRFIATNIGCWRWQGTATLDGEMLSGGIVAGRKANARFTIERVGTVEENGGFFDEYRIVDVHVDWSAGVNPCGDAKSGTATSSDAKVRIANWLPDSAAYRTYLARASIKSSRVSCDEPHHVTQSGIDWLGSLDHGFNQQVKVAPGGTIDDRFSVVGHPSAASQIMNTKRAWRLVPLRE